MKKVKENTKETQLLKIEEGDGKKKNFIQTLIVGNQSVCT